MNVRMILLAGVSFLSVHVDAQETGSWHSSWGPGSQANYSIEVDDTTQLSIACHDSEPVSMYATVNGKSYGSGEKDFTLMVDGTEYIVPPYKLAEFDQFWEALRHAQILFLATSGGIVKLPTQGLITALPALDHPDYICYTQPQSTEQASPQQATLDESATEEQSYAVVLTDTDTGKIDTSHLATEAVTADMSQTQMGAGDFSMTEETQPWYERMWSAVVDRIHHIQQELQRTVRKVIRFFTT